MGKTRLERINKLIRSTVAELLVTDVADPRLAKVSVTRADVSPDLSKAKIWYGCWDETKRDEAAKALNRARGFFRSALASRMNSKKVPEIFFEFDRNLDYADQINKVLTELKPGDADDRGSDPDLAVASSAAASPAESSLGGAPSVKEDV
jgi:ribosome-binding factor A